MGRWELYRCWQGNASTLVPQPTGYRYLNKRIAEGAARRMSAAMTNGVWFEARRAAK